MSKGARIRAIHADDSGVKVKLEIIMFNDGRVTISGPINDPVFTSTLLSAGLNALSQHWDKQRKEESRIVKPQTSLILPG